MPWHGTERRGTPRPDTGDRRRWDDLRAVHEELEDIQNELLGLKRLPYALGELKGKIEQLSKQVNQLMSDMTNRFDGLDGKADKLGSFKTATQFAAVVIVPILVALIGGYFLLRSAVPQVVPK